MWSRLKEKVVKTDSEGTAQHNVRSEKLPTRSAFIESMLPRGGVGAELGVHRGYFTPDLLELTRPSRLHLIDPWYLLGKEWKWGNGNRSTVDALVGVIHAFRDELVSGQVVLHIGGDLDILPTFPDAYFDWVYVDTSHTYEHTLAELRILKEKVKTEGIIAGDDWRSDPSHKHHGVCKAVAEFAAQSDYQIVYANATDLQWAIRRKA